jgi:predicted nicotinamide N-methyase
VTFTDHALEIEDERFPLQEFQLRAGKRHWTVRYTHSMINLDDEERFIFIYRHRVPYGVALWPSGVALAQEIATHAEAFAGARVLELGAGIGLAGIVAASLGAEVLQTDHDELTLTLCRQNATRNGAHTIEHRQVDWRVWDVEGAYDWIIGSDILYDHGMHAHLHRIFEANLADGGHLLLADPYRKQGTEMIKKLKGHGWRVGEQKRRVGDKRNPRTIGIFELRRHYSSLRRR